MTSHPGDDEQGFFTLVLAGGGNRCWWQAGALSHLLEHEWPLPRFLVGTSAGAAIAAWCLTRGPSAALDACLRLYAGNSRSIHWRNQQGRRAVQFAHRWIYPAWVESFVNAQTFDALTRAASSLVVAVTRPAALGLRWSVCVGTIAYLLDKKVWHNIHPRLPRLLGLRQEFVPLNGCRNADEARMLLCASAAPPPIMPALRIDGRLAFDGGYTDNAPIPEQDQRERSATLVMLTRYYGNRQQYFRHRDRLYWQPSRPVPVSTWDCSSKATVVDAFNLGYEDAHRAVRAGLLRQL